MHKYATVYNAMVQKTANLKFSDVPTEWKEHLTADERQLAADVLYKFEDLGNSAGEAAGSILTLFPNLIAAPIGVLAAGITPSYTDEDIRELVNDDNFGNKAAWIPGYGHYKAMKALGFTQRLHKLVRERKRLKKEVH